MKQFVAFDTESGGTIIVEIDEPGALVPAGLGSDTVEKASSKFEDVVKQIGPAISALINAIDQVRVHPDEIAVEFSFKLSAKFGAIILCSTEGEANYKVGLTWKRSKTS
jgi:hypothetical protein